MRTTATLLLLSAIGCGGAHEKSGDTTTTPAEPTAVAPAPSEAPAPVAEAPAATADAAAEPAVTPEPTSAPALARAELRMVGRDAAVGSITFERTDTGITIAGDFSGLKKGPHALYIHSTGDCSGKARKVGAHLNPTNVKHGPPASPTRHAGDFGDVTADKTGKATFMMTTDSITLEPDRPDSVVGRAVVIHSGKDNARGSAGGAIACGVVMLDGAAPSGAAGSAPTASTPAP
jgi:Cu/Zn superoxide dismutase